MGKRGPKPSRSKTLTFDTKMPSCPAWVGRWGKDEWKRLAKHLHVKGLLTEVDRQAFAAYCQAVHHMIELQKTVAKSGYSIEAEHGTASNPEWRALVQAVAMVERLGGRFGITPHARSGMKADGKEGTEGGNGSGSGKSSESAVILGIVSAEESA